MEWFKLKSTWTLMAFAVIFSAYMDWVFDVRLVTHPWALIGLWFIIYYFAMIYARYTRQEEE